MRRVAIVLVGALAMTATACTSAAPGTGTANTAPGSRTAHTGVLTGKTGTQILAAATSAAHAVGAARYTLTATTGSQKQIISGDATTSSARQKVKLGSQEIQVIYTGGDVFVKGNSSGLESAMGLSSTKASKYAGKWIAMKKSDSVYSAIVDSVNLDKTLQALAPSGNLTVVGPVTVHGRRAVGVRGGLPKGTQKGVTGTETLYVATTDPTVPLEIKGSANTGVTDVGTFSNWGETLALAAPSPTVPYAQVTAK